MRPLTDSERTLVMENKGLVYTVVYRMVRAGKLLPSLVEDAISEGMYGLMKAVVYYDPSRGYQFSTLAIRSIRRQILNFIETEITQAKHRAESLDDLSRAREGERLSDSFPAKDDVEQDAVNWLREAIDLISKDHPKAMYIETLMEYLSGRTMTEMAEERGVSKQRIQAIISEAKKILRNRLDRTDWS